MNRQRTIEQLVREAVNCDLLLIEANRTDYNFKILCALHNLRFRVWLRDNNLPPEENYTFDRFREYLIRQRTIEQLVREAVNYDLILIEADRTNYNYKISVECAVHNPQFLDWLRENNLPPEVNYTFDRFREYLTSRRIEKEERESIKKYNQNLVNGDNKPLPLSLPLPHFSRSFSRSEQKELFAGLTNGGFLPKTANFSHFCYVFGSTAIPDNEKPFKPLVWQKSKSLLAYFVVGMCEKYNLKHGEKRMIKPFENTFAVSGLTGAINDIKKAATPPVGCEMVDEILKLSKKFFNDNFINDK